MTLADVLGLCLMAVGIVSSGALSYAGLRIQLRERDEKARAGREFDELEAKVRELDKRDAGPSTDTSRPDSEPALEPVEPTLLEADEIPNQPLVGVVAVPTAPNLALGHFTRTDSDEPARVVLRLLGPDVYEVAEPFRYLDGDLAIVVPAGWQTDLVSIPRILRWFVTPYGPHTLPALLHEYLLEVGPHRGMFMSVDEADRIFLRALEAVGIPPVRRYIIAWTAILSSRWRRSIRTRLVVALWFALVTAAFVAGAYGIVMTNPWTVVAAVLVPFPAALLWGARRTFLGLTAGVTWPIVYLPGAVMITANSIYNVLERLVLFVARNRQIP